VKLDVIDINLTTAKGILWENNEHDALLNYINSLEDIITELESQILKLKNSPEYLPSKSEIIYEYLRSCKAVLLPDEFVFFFLKAAGYKYRAIVDIVGSLSRSRSTIQRKVQRAKTKLSKYTSIRNDKQVQS